MRENFARHFLDYLTAAAGAAFLARLECLAFLACLVRLAWCLVTFFSALTDAAGAAGVAGVAGVCAMAEPIAKVAATRAAISLFIVNFLLSMFVDSFYVSL